MEDLQIKTNEFLGGIITLNTAGLNVCPVSPNTSEVSAPGSTSSGSRFMDTVRKALISRVRNTSTESVLHHLVRRSQSAGPSPSSNRQPSTSGAGNGSSRRSVEPPSPVSSPDLTLRRDLERGSQSSEDNTLLNLDNQDSSLATVQQEESDYKESSSNMSDNDTTVVDETTISTTPTSATVQRSTHESPPCTQEQAAQQEKVTTTTEAVSLDALLSLPSTSTTTFTVAMEQMVTISQRVISESDGSSLNSELELDQALHNDSDTGLDSMSSAETHDTVRCTTQDGDESPEALRTEITKLKCDKLELLRQNVVSAAEL